jgi:hypothetical protein
LGNIVVRDRCRCSSDVFHTFTQHPTTDIRDSTGSGARIGDSFGLGRDPYYCPNPDRWAAR